MKVCICLVGVENESKGWGGEWRMRARDGEGSGE